MKALGKKMGVDVRQSDLEGYHGRRLDKGMTPRPIDMELSFVKTMVARASDNDRVTGREWTGIVLYRQTRIFQRPPKGHRKIYPMD